MEATNSEQQKHEVQAKESETEDNFEMIGLNDGTIGEENGQFAEAQCLSTSGLTIEQDASSSESHPMDNVREDAKAAADCAIGEGDCSAGEDVDSNGVASQGNGGDLQLNSSSTQQQKEWQNSITSELRTHLASKLERAIFRDSTALPDNARSMLSNYAKNVEKKMFEAANEKEEYYHLLAEKIYATMKEVQAKITQAATTQQSGNNPHGGASSQSVPALLEQTHGKSQVSQVLEEKPHANELRDQLKPVWDRLYNAEEGMPFRVPVDAVKLCIPDYHSIVKRPMDLSTILRKLNDGVYRSPWEFCDDMWLMFDNAWLYNYKCSKVYRFCTRLSELFVEEVNPLMRRMGYCCGQKFAFTSLPVVCCGCEHSGAYVIPPGQTYMHYEAGVGKFSYCPACFEKIPPEGICFGGVDPSSDTQRNMVPKSAFKPLINDQMLELEPFVDCQVCQRKWHQICALYNQSVSSGESFICDECRLKKNRPKPENLFTAKKLPHYKLSHHIEDRVNSFLDSKLPFGEKRKEIIIRVLSSVEKEVEVRPLMKQKAKAIYAFQLVDGVEVCFFGLHVQEYGTRGSAPPNARCVNIAYFDSVPFFEPGNLRTEVYHEILLGYLQHAKQLGFTRAHLWACPPVPDSGDDYIFHCHPPEQKILQAKRLQEWCKQMLEKGCEEHTVHEYNTDVYGDGVNPIALPYFEGDYWPIVIEDCIREPEEEKEKVRKAMKEQTTGVAAAEKDGILLASGKSTPQKGGKKQMAGVCISGDRVAEKVFNRLTKYKNTFFIIRLVSPNQELLMLELGNPIVDPDPLVARELMDERGAFLQWARSEHWEFSSLRRAKYSTMCFTYALHTRNNREMLGVKCDHCKQPTGTTAHWHCDHCNQDPGFDLCENCYEGHRHEHPHPLTKASSIDGEAAMDISEASSGGVSGVSSRKQSLQRCINTLAHACKCTDATCSRLKCPKMKKVVQHASVCKKRHNGCGLCKQVIALTCYHAKECVEATSCKMPLCSSIRQTLQEQRRWQTYCAETMMRRRLANVVNTEINSRDSSSNHYHSLAEKINSTQQKEKAMRQAHKRKSPTSEHGASSASGTKLAEHAGGAISSSSSSSKVTPVADALGKMAIAEKRARTLEQPGKAGGEERFPFLDSKHITNDVTFIVEGGVASVHANKGLLSVCSPVFASMFNTGESRHKNQIPLDDVTRAELIEFFRVIYPGRKPISENNVKQVLKLADRFHIYTAMEECEKFLLEKCCGQWSHSKLILIAQTYPKLTALKAHCLESINSAATVAQLCKEPSYRELSDRTKAEILDRFRRIA